MHSKPPPAILFREDQQFRDPVLWVILVVFAAFSLGTALYIMTRTYRAAEAGIPWQSWAMLGVFVVLPVLLVLLALAIAKFQIEVSTEGLFLRFFPLHWKVRKIDLADVEGIEAVTYHAVRDYGGFGIRLLPRAKAYSVGGGQGVRISYRNGYHLLLGTRHPRDLAMAVSRILPTLPPDQDRPGKTAPSETP